MKQTMKIFLNVTIALIITPGCVRGNCLNETGTLDAKQQSIVTIAAFTAIGDETGLKAALMDGLNAGYEFAPAIDKFLKEHLFGDVFGRDVLDFKTREIATISALASLGKTENQLRSHFNVKIHNGLTKEQLTDIVSIIQNKVGQELGSNASVVLQKLLNPDNSSRTAKRKTTESATNGTSMSPFPKGEKASSTNFTGTAWHHPIVTRETTPDGREGFQNIYLRCVFSVYLLDQPRRGEAGKSSVAATVTPTPDEQFWFTQFRNGIYPAYFQGVQFPKDSASLEQFFRQMTPNTGSFDVAIISDAVSHLFNKVSRGILITHSQGGGPGWLTAIQPIFQKNGPN